MLYKKLMPEIGLSGRGAVVLGDGDSPYTEDVAALSQYYSDNGADELFLYDKSVTDQEHDQVIGALKNIAHGLDIPFLAGGYGKRLEDVKKYLYAGAKAVFLDVSDEDNLDLIKEASDRFGSEKIYAYLPDASYLNRTKEYAQLGAFAMILETPELSDDLLQQMESSDAGFLVIYGKDADEAAASFLSSDWVEGMIFKNPAAGDHSLMVKKQKLKAMDIAVDTFESAVSWGEFKLNSDGLVPVIVQDYKTCEVLMLAYMNEEAFEATLKGGRMTYFSRSRNTLWLKGETSGHYQYVKSLQLDCDCDTILAKVRQSGAACHTGNRTCFFQTLAKKEYRETNPLKVFEDVFHTIKDRKDHPKEGSYTNYLFDKGIDKILKKVGEEATEIVIAAKNPDPEEIKYEIADFLYHVMVLMAEKGVSWEEITEELANR